MEISILGERFKYKEKYYKGISIIFNSLALEKIMPKLKNVLGIITVVAIDEGNKVCVLRDDSSAFYFFCFNNGE